MRHRYGHAVWTCSMDMCTAWKCRVDMKHGHAEQICRKDMQHGYAARTCRMDMKHGLAAYTCSMNMQHGHAAWPCNTGIQNGHIARTCSMNEQHGKASGTCRRDMNVHYSRPLLSPLPNGFGFWNRVSNVVRQKKRGKKVNLHFFLSHCALSLLSRSPALIYGSHSRT
jgi:hypothetical protein